ncbi:hypothetical protein QNH20_09960 [Neobacillus sp. WH10]|nr:hypothetical protein [Neobacillus sp. WH10]WHY79434.1 hypothetical protein QNH20_09960 [Neobacillus sp. WH10]
MYEGKIIKFYREKYKLTQEQLGKIYVLAGVPEKSFPFVNVLFS